MPRKKSAKPAATGENNPQQSESTSEEIGCLQAELESLRNAKVALEGELEQRRRHTAFVLGEHSDLQEEFLEFKKVYGRLVSDYSGQQQAYVSATSRCDFLSSTITIMEQTQERLQREARELKTRADNADADYKRVEALLVAAEQKIEDEKKKFAEEKKKMDIARATIDSLKLDLKNETLALRDAEEAALKNEAEATKNKDDFERVKGEKEKLEDRAKSQKTQMEGVQADNQGISTLLTQAQSTIDTFQTRITELESTVTAQGDLQAELDTERELVQSVRNQLQEMRSKPENQFPVQPEAFEVKPINGAATGHHPGASRTLEEELAQMFSSDSNDDPPKLPRESQSKSEKPSPLSSKASSSGDEEDEEDEQDEEELVPSEPTRTPTPTPSVKEEEPEPPVQSVMPVQYRTRYVTVAALDPHNSFSCFLKAWNDQFKWALVRFEFVLVPFLMAIYQTFSIPIPSQTVPDVSVNPPTPTNPELPRAMMSPQAVTTPQLAENDGGETEEASEERPASDKGGEKSEQSSEEARPVTPTMAAIAALEGIPGVTASPEKNSEGSGLPPMTPVEDKREVVPDAPVPAGTPDLSGRRVSIRRSLSPLRVRTGIPAPIPGSVAIPEENTPIKAPTTSPEPSTQPGSTPPRADAEPADAEPADAVSVDSAPSSVPTTQPTTINNPFYTIANREEILANAWSTFFTILFHLICLFVITYSINTVLERRRWFAANESTRTLLWRYLGKGRDSCASCKTRRGTDSGLQSFINTVFAPDYARYLKIGLLRTAEVLVGFKVKTYPRPG